MIVDYINMRFFCVNDKLGSSENVMIEPYCR